MGHEFPGRIRDLECRVKRFTAEHIYQAKAVQCRLVHETNKRCTWQPVLREFRARAKAESLWIFPPPKAVEDHGFYLRKYALIAEAMSTTPIGTETINYYTGTIWRLQQLLRRPTATVHHYHLPRLLGGEVRVSSLLPSPTSPVPVRPSSKSGRFAEVTNIYWMIVSPGRRAAGRKNARLPSRWPALTDRRRDMGGTQSFSCREMPRV